MSTDPLSPSTLAELSGAQLRLFTPALDDGLPSDGVPSAEMTWTEFYESYVEPYVLAHDSPRHHKEMRITLGYWRRFTGAALTLRQTSHLHAVQFVEGLKTLPGRYEGELLADNTIRKHCRHMQKILDSAGPEERKQQLNAGVLERIVYLSRPAEFKTDDPPQYSLDDLGMVLDGCDAATVSGIPGVPPSRYFRAIFRFDANVGQRTGSLRKLRFDWIEEGCWLRLPARSARDRAVKGRQGKRIYLNEAARAVIDDIRSPERELVFPWPYSEGYFYRQVRKIVEASGVARQKWHYRPLHSVRKYLVTTLTQKNSIAAQKALGHVDQRVTSGHYAGIGVMCEAMDGLQQPRLSGRQMQLFD